MINFPPKSMPLYYAVTEISYSLSYNKCDLNSNHTITPEQVN